MSTILRIMVHMKNTYDVETTKYFTQKREERNEELARAFERDKTREDMFSLFSELDRLLEEKRGAVAA